MGNNSNSKLISTYQINEKNIQSKEKGEQLKEKDEPIKIKIVGNTGVGKSCFLDRFVDNEFTENKIGTSGYYGRTKEINIQNKKILLGIIDILGQKKYRGIEEQFYNSVKGIILMYDIHDQDSFKSILNRNNSIFEFDKNNNICKVLVGNKCDDDLNRVVTKKEGINLAEELGIGFFGASAKRGINVNEVFYFITEKILKNFKEKIGTTNDENFEKNRFDVKKEKSSELKKGKLHFKNKNLEKQKISNVKKKFKNSGKKEKQKLNDIKLDKKLNGKNNELNKKKNKIYSMKSLQEIKNEKTEEINKNEIELQNSDNVLKEFVIIENNNENKKNEEILNLKNELKNYHEKIEKQKLININLENQLNRKNNELNKLKNEINSIKSLQEIINEKEQEINKLNITLQNKDIILQKYVLKENQYKNEINEEILNLKIELNNSYETIEKQRLININLANKLNITNNGLNKLKNEINSMKSLQEIINEKDQEINKLKSEFKNKINIFKKYVTKENQFKNEKKEEILNLKNELKNSYETIEKQKLININLENQLKNTNNELHNLKHEINSMKSLQKIIKEKEEEIN